MRTFILHNKPTVAIVIFLILFSTMHMIKPSFVYDTDGSFRKFGVGYTHKTVVPVWIISIVLGIVSYLGVLSFLAHY